jgi:hypothetical protein
MDRPMTEQRIADENETFAGTGGRSAENRELRFEPAFYDYSRNTIYRSRFADGRDAPFHTLDGLPDEAVMKRDASGRVIAARPTIISGFVRDGFFYTRSAAARAVREWTADDEIDVE